MLKDFIEVFRQNLLLLYLAGSVLGTVLGLVSLLLGCRLYRVIAAFYGLILGCVTALALCARYLPGHHSLLYYFLGLLGAALIGAVFYYVSIFLLGATLGVAVAHLVSWAWLGSQGITTSAAYHGLLVSYVVAGLAAGCLALVFRRPFLILITSLGGASITVTCAGMSSAGFDWAWKTSLLGWVLAGVALVALTVTGVIVQWKATPEHEGVPRKRKPAKTESRKTELDKA